ncbi:hypothetical protein SLS64_001192 [Diaporthe eres]
MVKASCVCGNSAYEFTGKYQAFKRRQREGPDLLSVSEFSGKDLDTYFLKAGLIDDNDFLNTLGTPKMEIYCKYLWNWERTFEGAQVTQN